MKPSFLLRVATIVFPFFTLACWEVELNDPLLPGSRQFVGDALAIDSDHNGLADLYEVCEGDRNCMESTAAAIGNLCNQESQCQLNHLVGQLEEYRATRSVIEQSSSAVEVSSSAIEPSLSGSVFSEERFSSSYPELPEVLSGEVVMSSSLSSFSFSSSSLSFSSSSTGTVVGCPSWSRKNREMEIIGFWPSYGSGPIPWGKITQLNYAFGIPTSQGGLNANLATLQSLVITGHQNGVEVWLSIGGAGYSDVYPSMAANSQYRATFVENVRSFAQQSCIDGVDIDWESWSGSASGTVNPQESALLTTMLSELRAVLAPLNIKLSTDVYPSDWNGRHYEAAIITHIDQLNVMAYDFTGSWSPAGNHSSYNDTRYSVNYWNNKVSSQPGYSSKKMILGVPFYGKDFSQGAAAITYKDILARYPATAAENATSQIEKIYYNAKPLLRQKMGLIKNSHWGGVMIWELSQDDYNTDANSLLDAIFVSSGNP